MISSQEKTRLKGTSIVDYLASQGYHPVKTSGNEYVYYSPIRTENTPSFFVNPKKNLYQDYGKDGGDIIKLVSELNNTDFAGAISLLSNWQPGTFTHNEFERIPMDRESSSQIEIISVQAIRHQALISYLESRRIPFSFAAKYLKEVHYQNKGKRFFSLGFSNDNGGWALRNERFKNCIGINGCTHLKVPGSNDVSVFEGFFDFLSALVFNKVTLSQSSVLVLNSTSNLKAAFPILETYDHIFTYFDNDQAGKNAFQALLKRKFPIIDQSYIYEGYNDFSEFLCRKTDT
jgi:DNA primase